MGDLIKRFFTVAVVMQIINQVKTTNTFVFDKLFKSNAKSVLGNSVDVPIKKGAGVVLESVSPSAEHLIHEESDKYIVTIPLPRFPLEAIITANELNTIKSLESQNDQVESLSKRIGEILKEQKTSFLTTYEHMCGGALFGKVTDGKGNVLFEIKNNNNPIEFKDIDSIAALNKIDEQLEGELGIVPEYEVLASRTFIDELSKKAVVEDLFKQGLCRWEDDNGRRVLFVHGKKFIPYSATYKNQKGTAVKFIADKKAVVIPSHPDIYQFFYGRADHTSAVTKAPTMFFSAAPEELAKGRGYSIISETKAIPVCLRPEALINLSF